MESERLGVTSDAATDRARRFALEIASDFSYPVVRAGELLLRRLWHRLYDGVEVHHGDDLAKVAPGKEFVYLPNHRSHIDYLLLSYLVHAQGFAPPHIAAGANLNLPIVGPFLRRGGAFFLRRSFKGEPLYAAVFRAAPAHHAGPGVSNCLFHRGGPQSQRPNASAQRRPARHNHRELHARPSATTAAGAGEFQLRKEPAPAGPHARRGTRRAAQAA